MIPIQELLTRIRWDEKFADARFELGYYDRVEGRIIRIPLGRAAYDRPDDPSFQLVDEEGRTVSIPFHRVRQVFRDGELIWNRPSRDPASG